MRGRVLSYLLMLLLAVPPAGAEPVVLKANLQGSISHPFYGWSMARLKEEVERQSGGSLVIQIAEKLFRDDQVIGAVTSGGVEIGFTSSTMFADRVPAVAIIGQPFLFNFPAPMRAATSPGSEIRTLIDDGILRQMGLRVLWWQSNSVNAFLSKGWDAADVGLLQGKRVAMPTKTAGGLIAHCGGVPIVLSAERHEAGIKDGTVGMAMLAFPEVPSQGLWKATDTITFTAHAPVEMLLVINEKAWQSLSARQQAILQRPRVLQSARAASGSRGLRPISVRSRQATAWRSRSSRLTRWPNGVHAAPTCWPRTWRGMASWHASSWRPTAGSEPIRQPRSDLVRCTPIICRPWLTAATHPKCQFRP